MTAAVDGGGITVALTLTNTGGRGGAEAAQVYTGLSSSAVSRARRELKGFTKVHLGAGESRQVETRDLRGSVSAEVASDKVRVQLTADSSTGEVMAHPVVGPIVTAALSRVAFRTHSRRCRGLSRKFGGNPQWRRLFAWPADGRASFDCGTVLEASDSQLKSALEEMSLGCLEFRG